MNNIEKKLRKRGMKKLDKFAHNPYHVAKPSLFSKIPLWTKIVVPAVAMTAVTFVASISLINHLGSHNASPASMSNKGEGTYYSSIAAPEETSQDKAINSNSSSTGLDGGGDYTTPEGYPAGITFQGAQYNFLYNSPARTGADYGTISADKLGNVIGETTGEKTITVYEIQNYSSKAFIAMKFSNSNIYYVAANSYNVYSTLDDFLTQTNFINGSKPTDPVRVYKDSVGNVENYKNADKASVNGCLFADTNIANNPEDFEPYAMVQGLGWIKMTYLMTDFNSSCISLTLYDTGHLSIHVGTASTQEEKNIFKIGVDKFNALLSYVETLTKTNQLFPDF